MPDDPILGEPPPSLLDRLAGLFTRRQLVRPRRTVQRREHLDLLVPSNKADVVRAAVERWLEAQGVAAGVTLEDAGNDRSRIRARLDETESSKIDFSADHVQSGLEDVLADAMS